MSRTPEVIVVKWRKFLHDLFEWAAGISGLVALVSFLAGGSWFLAFVVFVLAAITASKIKYKLVKGIEVGGYRWE